MIQPHLLKLLTPNGPLHKRTERDVFTSRDAELRAKSAGALRELAIRPGIQTPSLISSCSGSIDAVLFSFPRYGVTDRNLAAGYQSVIRALRQGTEFVVVVAKSSRTTVERWFTKAGHGLEQVTFVTLPDYVSFTDWAEDGYVSLVDASDESRYLLEPWEFPRAADSLIAESVQEYTATRAAQAPLIFQGGNCLVGSDFWLLGKDYFADSVELITQSRAPVQIPGGTTAERFARQLFSDYVDSTRRLVVVGTRRPIPIRPFYGTRSDDEYFLDIAADGAGTFQPIFHIDMFVTLIGEARAGGFEVFVGSPAMGDVLTGRVAPFSLDDVYDTIARSLSAAGFTVHRNPLVHRPASGQRLTLAVLLEAAASAENADLGPAVDELVAAGATDSTLVTVRSWHHVTWNNCLVENSAALGKHVYLPTYGHGSNADLKPVDEEMKRLWEQQEFTVHPLGDFNRFAERQGAVHCIKKYLRRGK